MFQEADKITRLADATGWKFEALRKQTIVAIKIYKQMYGCGLKEAKDDVRAWQDWVFKNHPDWEWQIHAIGEGSDVQRATELFMKIRPNGEYGIGWHRDMVVSFQQAWEKDGAVGWGVGALEKVVEDKMVTGSLEDVRTKFQRGN